MSFMMFPPEVNSALMYSGAGSGPLMAAASAWDELAADLETTATSYQSVIAQLIGGPWLGPTSARMASATAPFIAWLQGSSDSSRSDQRPGQVGCRRLRGRVCGDGAAGGDRGQSGAVGGADRH